MNTLRQKVIAKLRNRRQRILDGYVNCIPSPFKRFIEDYGGLEQDTYYCVTSFTKGGKSQFVSYTMMYSSLLYAYLHPEKDIDITFLYFPLEETPERIMERFMSYLLYEKSNLQTHISPKALRSTHSAVNEDIISTLESEEYDKILEFFENHIVFLNETNPTGIMKACVAYAETVGTTTRSTYIRKGELGQEEKEEKFESYALNNPSKYIVPIIDTINLIDTERGMTLKQAMDKMSEYCAKILRNRYHMSPIVIQQQAFETEKVDEFKMKNGNIRPSVAGLGDSKYVSRDANIVLGLFSPARFGIHDYKGYNIDKFDDNIRFLEVCVNRDGEMGGMTALYFDGACCYFNELPPAKLKDNRGNWVDNPAMANVYSFLESQRNQQSMSTARVLVAWAHNLINSIYSKWQTL